MSNADSAATTSMMAAVKKAAWNPLTRADAIAAGFVRSAVKEFVREIQTAAGAPTPTAAAPCRCVEKIAEARPVSAGVMFEYVAACNGTKENAMKMPRTN